MAGAEQPVGIGEHQRGDAEADDDGGEHQRLRHRVESLSGLAYVALGVIGMAWAGGFLDNRILPLGQHGQILSAGAIPLIYTLIGLKVGAEFSSILESLEETEDA